MKSLQILSTAVLLALALVPARVGATKVFLNYSNQVNNSVCAGGVESTYAADNAARAMALLTNNGFEVRKSDDFDNSNAAAQAWGANAFLSIHSNAGGGHGAETLKGWYLDSANFGSKFHSAFMTLLPYQSRGVKDGSCGGGRCYVLNRGDTAALVEVVFHDCCKTSGYTGHPPSEAAYLVSTSGRETISKGIAKGICNYFGKSCNLDGGGTVTPTNGTLIGLVYKNGDSAQRVPGATVKLNTNATTTSNSTGVYSFSVPAGNYSVTVSAAGYQTATKTCPAVTAGGEAWCSVNLVAETTSTTGFIKGVVYKNGATTDRVVPATVRLSTGASVNYTDSSSLWSFEVPVGSNYSVSVQATGYQDASRTCGAVTAGAITWCSIEVTAVPAPTTGVLEGIVYTGGNKANKVSPATVTLNNGSTTTYSGSAKWSFTLAPATYTASVQSAGYQPRTNVSCPAVTAGGTAVCDVELQPLVTTPDAGTPAPDAGQPVVDAGVQPETDAGEQQADAGEPAAAEDAGSSPVSDAAIQQGEMPTVPDTGCGCTSGAGAVFGLFALPAMFALRPRRRQP